MALLTQQITRFSHFLRDRGFAPGIQQTLDAIDAAAAVNVTDRASFKCALKATLCSSKEEWDLFDSVFEHFWKRSGAQTPAAKARAKPSAKSGDGPQMQSQFSDADHQSDDGRSIAGSSLQERLMKADFAEVGACDLAELERLATRLLTKLSQRISRRFRASRRNVNRADLRRTLRQSVSTGGVPLRISRKSPKPRPAKLAILLDISGSMNAYSLFLLRFAYALHKHFSHSGTFIFSTHVQEITDSLKSRDLTDAFQKLAAHYAGWSGGTRIGESLCTFRETLGKRLLTRHTVVIILSDGWETGEPELLGQQMAAVRGAVRKVIWLTPLLGMSDYQPLTRGIRAALPYIDVFAPAHNLQSLLQLERHLYV